MSKDQNRALDLINTNGWTRAFTDPKAGKDWAVSNLKKIRNHYRSPWWKRLGKRSN